ncbi:MAG: flagellar hook protein FlgE [Anaerolineae bacterium]|nr:flagellar hook protein FlgE [Anaerolineae bacterium]
MLRSLVSAASALRFHQTFMDVVANNIANVNTTAFKSSRITFQEMMNQLLSSGSGPDPNGGRGGVNPIQLGLGMTLGSVDTQFTQGGLQATGRASDLAIQGDGFFIFQGPNQQLYSRDGTLDVATDGTLVNPSTGLHVLGWQADANGHVDTTQPLSAITIPLGQGLMARATSRAALEGNLDASAAVNSQVTSSVVVYDSLGNVHTITLTFTKADNNQWNVSASEDDDSVTIDTADLGTLTFDSTGRLETPADGSLALGITLSNGATSPQTVTLDMSALTQLADTSEVAASSQDGVGAGELISFEVTTDGEVIGVYSNGFRQTVGQIALASFRNPAGLIKVGENLYAESVNTGNRTVGAPGQGGRGQINSGYLEMSNVELATQFTDMIRAQRGFQANSRVITASDQMLQELVNLIR